MYTAKLYRKTELTWGKVAFFSNCGRNKEEKDYLCTAILKDFYTWNNWQIRRNRY